MDRTLMKTYALSKVEFGRVISSLLKVQGYQEVRLVDSSGERGVDLVCRDPDGVLVAVQGQMYDPAKTIGSLAIRHLADTAVSRQAHRAIYITTAMFSQSASQQAVDFDIELVDGQSLARLLEKHKIIVGGVLTAATEARDSSTKVGLGPSHLVEIPYDEVFQNQKQLQQFLRDLPPEYPATLRNDWPDATTDERLRFATALSGFDTSNSHQFRQAVALIDGQVCSQLAGYGATKWSKIRVSFLNNDGANYLDYVLDIARHSDGTNLRKIVRTHRVHAQEVLTAHDVYEFLKYVNEYGPEWDREYITNGYFSCGAYAYIASLEPEHFKKLSFALIDGPSLARGYFARSQSTYLAEATREELPRSFELHRRDEVLLPPRPALWRRFLPR